jgi:hypothetical protein
VSVSQLLLMPDGPAPGEFEVPDGAEITSCKSCGAAIIWTTTPKGRAIPLDTSAIRMVGLIGYAKSHFVTCPDAKEWRKNTR